MDPRPGIREHDPVDPHQLGVDARFIDLSGWDPL